jgi:uncharacterized protein
MQVETGIARGASAMDQKERQVIDELFGKLRQLDQQAPQRDAEAERYIAQQLTAMPAAPYYMAQALLVQEQALGNLQNRVQELERQVAQRPEGGGGSFLGNLFGVGTAAPQAQAPQRSVAPPPPGPIPQQYLQPGVGAGGSPWGRPMGGGFLAGAMQTAVGVAGGMLVADALSHAFSAGASEVSGLASDAGWTAPAAEPAPAAQEASWDEPTPPEPDLPRDAGFDDPGFDDGGGDGSFDV